MGPEVAYMVIKTKWDSFCRVLLFVQQPGQTIDPKSVLLRRMGNLFPTIQAIKVILRTSIEWKE